MYIFTYIAQKNKRTKELTNPSGTPKMATIRATLHLINWDFKAYLGQMGNTHMVII